MKCELCGESKATFQCQDCGAYCCESCADLYEYTCDCIGRNIKE